MLRCTAAIAALALVAGVAAAEPGGGKGHGGNPGGGHAESGAKGQAGPRAGGHGERKNEAAKRDAPPGGASHGGNRAPGQAPATGEQRAEGRGGRPGVEHARPARSERHEQRRASPAKTRQSTESPRRGGLQQERTAADKRLARNGHAARALLAGCPPALAASQDGCTPPSEMDRRRGWQPALSSPAWWGLAAPADAGFAYVDGYLVRIGGSRITGWLPLLGGALAPGNPWPSAYPPVELPSYTRDYFGLGPSYRSHDDVLYRIDPQTSAIASIAALLTGDRFTVGEPMPSGYDVYNVPSSYRDRYADNAEAQYRYSDGYVYRTERETGLVTAAFELLT